MKFEEAMNKLEETVKKLENSETTLDDAMLLFEEGVKLSRTCQQLLNEAQLKVTQVVGNSEKEEVEFDTENL